MEFLICAFEYDKNNLFSKLCFDEFILILKQVQDLNKFFTCKVCEGIFDDTCKRKVCYKEWYKHGLMTYYEKLNICILCNYILKDITIGGYMKN